jgi:hypothetical protein
LKRWIYAEALRVKVAWDILLRPTGQERPPEVARRPQYYCIQAERKKQMKKKQRNKERKRKIGKIEKYFLWRNQRRARESPSNPRKSPKKAPMKRQIAIVVISVDELI